MSPAVAPRRSRRACASAPRHAPRAWPVLRARWSAGRRGRRRLAAVRSGVPYHRPRRRPGRRDPGRGLSRRPDADRRRTRSRPAARRARRAHAAVGPADRRRDPDPPARGPRRRAGPAARPLPGRAGVRAGHARARARLRRLAGRPRVAGRRRSARARAGDRLRSTRSTLRVLWPIRGQVPASRRMAGPASTTSRSSCSAGSGPSASCWPATSSRTIDPSCWPRPAAGRLPQGRPSRQPDGVDPALRRRGAAAGRDRLGRRGQPVRPSGPRDARAARGRRGPRLPDRPRWHRRGELRAGGMTVQAEGGGRPRPAAAARRTASPAAPPAFRCGGSPTAGGRWRLPGGDAQLAGRAHAAATGPAGGGRRPSGTIEPMTVPGRVEAASLLLSLDPPPWFLRHARAVAEVAGWLAARIDGRGIAGGPAGWSRRPRCCTTSTRCSAGRTIRPAPSPTATGSADWLTRQGHPELARARRRTIPSAGSSTGSAYKRWSAFAGREERIVAYADKRAGQRLESMAAASRSGDAAIR